MHAKKEYREAIDVYTLALSAKEVKGGLAEDTDLDSVILSNRSACHLTLGRVDEALRDAKRAAEVRPGWPKAHWRVGRAFEALNDHKRAADAYRRGMELIGSEKSKAEFSAAVERCMSKA